MEFVFRKEEHLDLGNNNTVTLIGYVVEIAPSTYVVTTGRFPNKGYSHQMTFIYDDLKSAVNDIETDFENYKHIYTKQPMIEITE